MLNAVQYAPPCVVTTVHVTLSNIRPARKLDAYLEGLLLTTLYTASVTDTLYTPLCISSKYPIHQSTQPSLYTSLYDTLSIPSDLRISWTRTQKAYLQLCPAYVTDTLYIPLWKLDTINHTRYSTPTDLRISCTSTQNACSSRMCSSSTATRKFNP